jgi:MraZ protein
VFFGGNPINLDAKGRMALPTRFRESLTECCNGRLTMTVHHQDRCLLLYPYPEWEEIQRKLTRLPNQDKKTRWLQRMVLGHAVEVEMDGSGRVVIPPRLRAHANLDKRVVLAGLGNKFEIWNEEVWDQTRDEWVNEDHADTDLPDTLGSLAL